MNATTIDLPLPPGEPAPRDPDAPPYDPNAPADEFPTYPEGVTPPPAAPIIEPPPYDPDAPVIPPPTPREDPPPQPEPQRVFFSPSTLGFYALRIHGLDGIPDDAVEVTPEYHAQLLTENANGRPIVWDEGSQQPITIDPPPPDIEAIRAQRNNRLRATDWTQLPDVPPRIRIAYAVYRQQLRDLMAHLPPDLSNVVWPTLPVVPVDRPVDE